MPLNFSFNTLRNVHRVGWKEEAPDHRICSDGINWLAYCFNQLCPAYTQQVTINRGFGYFKFRYERKNLLCPACKKGDQLDFRNVGFVNSEWALKAAIKGSGEGKVYTEGRTYDGKLYTFKEIDLK